MIKNFRHACIVVRDLDKSLRFYRDILGLKVDKILTVKGNYPETVFNIKGLKLTYVKMRNPDQPKDTPPIFDLHYWVTPRRLPKPVYNNEYRGLTKLGVKFISPPQKSPNGKTKICFGYDPDKNLIEFVEDLKK